MVGLDWLGLLGLHESRPDVEMAPGSSIELFLNHIEDPFRWCCLLQVLSDAACRSKIRIPTQPHDGDHVPPSPSGHDRALRPRARGRKGHLERLGGLPPHHQGARLRRGARGPQAPSQAAGRAREVQSGGGVVRLRAGDAVLRRRLRRGVDRVEGRRGFRRLELVCFFHLC